MPEQYSRAMLLAGFTREFETIRTAADPASERAAFMKRTRATAARFFDGREATVASILDEMDAMLAVGDERFPETIAEKLGRVFEEIYRDPETAEKFHAHMRDVERGERDRIVAAAEGTSLSPLGMLYGKPDQDSDTFRLHIALAKTLEPTEMLRDFQNGMKELARLLEDDPELSRVKEVVGTSWIVGEKSKLAKLIGFHVADEPLSPEEARHFGGETRRVQKAWLTRDEVIAKFGETKSP